MDVPVPSAHDEPSPPCVSSAGFPHLAVFAACLKRKMSITSRDDRLSAAVSRELVELTPSFPLMSDVIVERLRSKILNGEVSPASKIDQGALAREFGVSRTPVREALKRLEVEGLVELLPHRGAIIAALSASELEEVYAVRLLLEGFAARMATSRRTPAEIEQLERILAEMDRYLRATAYDELMALNDSFHEIVYGRMQGSGLVDLIRPHWRRSQRYRLRYAHLPGRASQIQAEHHTICDAWCDGNAERVEEAVKAHLFNVAMGVLQDFEPDHKPTLLLSAMRRTSSFEEPEPITVDRDAPTR